MQCGHISSIFASHDDPDIFTITHKFNNTVTIVVQAPSGHNQLQESKKKKKENAYDYKFYQTRAQLEYLPHTKGRAR